MLSEMPFRLYTIEKDFLRKKKKSLTRKKVNSDSLLSVFFVLIWVNFQLKTEQKQW